MSYSDIWYGICINQVEFVRQVAIFLDFIPNTEKLTMEHINIIDDKLFGESDVDYNGFKSVEQVIHEDESALIDTLLARLIGGLHRMECEMETKNIPDDKLYHEHIWHCEKKLDIPQLHFAGMDLIFGFEFTTYEDIRLNPHYVALKPCEFTARNPRFAHLDAQFQKMGFATDNMNLYLIKI
jgi:hypothetical protein